VGLHSVGKVIISECIGWTEDTKDTCERKLRGSYFRPEDESEAEEEEADEPEENIEQVLEEYIASIYADLGTRRLPWLDVEDKSWYMKGLGQIHDNYGMPTDRYMYDFMDARGKYVIDVTLAAKCNARATCFMFPRCYKDTL
jgi:hypothetical protein